MERPAELTPKERPARSARAGDVDMPRSGERVLDILEFFRAWQRPARAVQVSRALGVPHSSIDRVLKTMVAKGYLAFNEVTKLYAPTYRIIRTGNDIERAFFGGPGLNHIVERLQRETSKTAFLCVQNGCFAQCVATQPGDNYVPAIHKEGVAVPVLASGPGLALMSTKTDLEVLDTARRSFQRNLFSPPWSALPDLLKHVRRVRERRFASWKGYCYPDAVGVFAAVKVVANPLPVSVGFIGHNPHNSEQTEANLGSLLLGVISRIPEVRIVP